ncbi:hypothetical protein AERO9A_420397 [Aeromonas salmonicida]|nr:hypothetical protein AERO9A_420397 [Aeromonas salmonicida]
MANGVTHRHLTAHRIKAILSGQDQQIGWLAHRDAVAILHIQGAGAMAADQFQTVVDLLIPHDLAHMQPHVEHLQHVGGAHGIPGIEHIIVAEADIDVGLKHLLHPGNATTLGIGIEPALQVDVHQRIGDEVDIRHLEQTEQAGSIGPVVGVHGCGMAGGHPMAHAALVGQGRQCLDKAGLLVIDLVTMNIHQNLILLGKIEDVMQTFDPVFPGELEMGYGTNHIGSQPERLFQQGLAVGIREDPLLREGDDLQLDPLLHLLPHLQHGFQGHQIGVGDIHMGADKLDAVGHLPFQGLDGPLLHIFMSQQRLALGPALYPLEQGTGQVPARLPGGLGSVEVNMRFDKRCNSQACFPIQLPGRQNMSAHGRYGPDQPILTEDLPHPLPVSQTHILYQHVFHPFSDTYYLSNRQLSSDQFNRTAFMLNTYEADTIGKRQQ